MKNISIIRTIKKRLIIVICSLSLIFIVLCIAMICCLKLMGPKGLYQVDLSRNPLPAYTHFFEFPKQKNTKYPIIYELDCFCFSDFSGDVFFEATPKWIEEFIRNNNLVSDELVYIPTTTENLISSIFPNVQNPEKLRSFSGVTRFTQRGNSYQFYYTLYTNEIETIVVLHFYSPEHID